MSGAPGGVHGAGVRGDEKGRAAQEACAAQRLALPGISIKIDNAASGQPVVDFGAHRPGVCCTSLWDGFQPSRGSQTSFTTGWVRINTQQALLTPWVESRSTENAHHRQHCRAGGVWSDAGRTCTVRRVDVAEPQPDPQRQHTAQQPTRREMLGALVPAACE